LQHFVPDQGRYPIADDDAHIIRTAEELPPAIILDFMYGAAAYQQWKPDKTSGKYPFTRLLVYFLKK